MGSRPFPRWGWTVHGDGKHITPGDVVAPEERLSWGRTIGIGMQHVIAMFGATLLVPTLTGFPVNTTLLFSGVGTIVFLLITRNRLPSYLGSSFAFIAPLTATQGEGIAVQLGGIVVVGVVVVALGVVVKTAGGYSDHGDHSHRDRRRPRNGGALRHLDWRDRWVAFCHGHWQSRGGGR